MKVDRAIEKIILTEREAKILKKAFEITMDIRDNSETIARSYAETVLEALNDLINDPSGEHKYTIGYEKQNKQKQMIFVAVEL